MRFFFHNEIFFNIKIFLGDIMEFENKLRDFIETKCEDYFLGTVDLSNAENSITGKYSALLKEYPQAISIGVTIPPIILNESKYNVNAINNVYITVHHILKSITSYLSNLLEHEGYNALAVPTTKGIMDKTYVSFHEIVANLANMGKFEKNYLVTPQVGSRVNWGTVLTNAPLNFVKNEIKVD